MNANTPALREYAKARAMGIAAALSFDPKGRPGATEIREDQARLRAKKASMHNRVLENLAPKTPYCPQIPRSLDRASAYARRRGVREAPVRMFLAEIDARKADMAEGSPRELFGMTMTSPLALYGIHPLGSGWFYRQIEDTDADYHAYSKAWHRQYGPKITVTRRAVTFRRMDTETRQPDVRTVELAGWRGDWLAKSIVEANLAPKKSSAPVAVRLHSAYDAELVENRHGYRFYRRTLLGNQIDWCVVSPMGTTFHAKDRKSLLSGLHAKIRAQKLKLSGRVIDWKKCRSLGFCEVGIRSFCDAFGLNPNGAYYPEELESLVRANLADARPFMAELRTLAAAVGLAVPEFSL